MIRNIKHENSTIYFVADDLGMPVSFGYLTEKQAEEVAELIESSEGMAPIPRGTNVEAIIADANEPGTTVCGVQVQHDNSSVGHNWRNIDANDIPANVVVEIEGEIIDGGKESCEDFVASNGLHYRW
jgi:hypothetical protein